MLQTHIAFPAPSIPIEPFPPKKRMRKEWPSNRRLEIAPQTGPLDAFRSQRVLLLADIENLFYSARDLGKKVSFSRLAKLLQRNTSASQLYAFYSREAGDKRREAYFLERGWKPVPNDIQVVQTYQGIQRRANSDNMILLYAGYLISRSRADVICIASGDGAMVSDMARAIAMFPKSRTVVTLSLAGATSYQLDASKNPHIYENIELGLDCLLSIQQKPILNQEVESHV